MNSVVVGKGRIKMGELAKNRAKRESENNENKGFSELVVLGVATTTFR